MSDYCETPEFYRETLRKARKEHRCCETLRPILPGQMYWDITAKYDGQIIRYTQSESAYHFARYVNWGLIGTCALPFGGISEDLGHYFDVRFDKHDDEQEHEVTQTWEKICSGTLAFHEGDVILQAENELKAYAWDIYCKDREGKA